HDGPVVRMWSSMSPAETCLVPSIFSERIGGSSGFGGFPPAAVGPSAKGCAPREKGAPRAAGRDPGSCARESARGLGQGPQPCSRLPDVLPALQLLHGRRAAVSPV